MDTTVDESVWQHHYTKDPVRLHYVEAGQGPLVIMLHGFPEAWFSWGHQMAALARAGFRAVAADMRGYNLSDKPRGIDSYTLDLLTGDIARLIEACGAERTVIMGHDWGAYVAWYFARRWPELVERLVIMNVPYPSRLARGLRMMPRQMLRSWYILFFQLPWLPEATLRAADYAALRWTFRHDPIRRGAFTEANIQRYVEALKQPGALTGSINYYRALARRGPGRLRGQLHPVECPVLVVWGAQDRYLEAALAAPPAERVPHCRVEYLKDASHFVQNDRPEQVNRLILEFLAAI